jgi:hypothetical protein
MRHAGFDEESIYAALDVTNRNRCTPLLPDAAIKRISKSAGRYDPDPLAGTTVKLHDPNVNGTEVKGPYTFKASEVVPRQVEWLWPGRIPLGKLTTFAGIGGLGKTFVLCDLSARVSRGMIWPYCDGMRAPPGRVLFITGEDDPDDTLVPRLKTMGADLDHISFMKTECQDHFLLADIALLEHCLEEIGPELRLVVIDPPTAFLGETNDHNNAELRAVLSPLKSWAARGQLACIFNTHFNKPGAAKNVDAMTRVMGSVAWVNAVRAAHAFCRDPEDTDKVLFCPMKMNLCKRGNGLTYTIEQTVGGNARVQWLGEASLTADEAVNGGARPRQVAASTWLIDRFREQLEWPSDVLFEAAAQEGISKNAIYDAKRTLKIPKAKQIIKSTGDRVFIWWVPDDWPNLHP